jgi:hypothetical protein
MRTRPRVSLWSFRSWFTLKPQSRSWTTSHPLKRIKLTLKLSWKLWGQFSSNSSRVSCCSQKPSSTHWIILMRHRTT